MSDQTVAVAVEATEIKFKDDLVAAAGHFTPQYTSDNATGTLVLPEGMIFTSPLATQFGVTEESYANHRQFSDLLNNALTHSAAEKAVEMFKGNKELQTVTLKAPIWKKDAYEGVFNRTGTSRNPKTGDVSNYVGAVGVGRINVVSTRSQSEWQGIKQNMRNMATLAEL